MQNKKPTKKTQLGVTEAPKRRGRPRKHPHLLRIKTVEEFKKEGMDPSDNDGIRNWSSRMEYLCGKGFSIPNSKRRAVAFRIQELDAAGSKHPRNWIIERSHYIKYGEPGFELPVNSETTKSKSKAIKPVKTVKVIKAVKQPSKVATVMTFMEKAKNASKPNPAVKELSDKMLFVSANSLKNLKWVKEGDRLELLPGGQ